MPDRLKTGKRVVGTKALLRELHAGNVRVAYMADDVDLYITQKVEGACREANVPLVRVGSMRELGRLCEIPVPAASAGLLR